MKSHVPTRPLVFSPVSCGFPSPAEEAEETSLNLHEYVVENKPATFFVRASGQSMEGAGILAGDILVVDRSRQPQNGGIVVAIVDGEFLVKKYVVKAGQIWLMPCHPSYTPMRIDHLEEVQIWGVVTHGLHHFLA